MSGADDTSQSAKKTSEKKAAGVDDKIASGVEDKIGGEDVGRNSFWHRRENHRKICWKEYRRALMRKSAEKIEVVKEVERQ